MPDDETREAKRSLRKKKKPEAVESTTYVSLGSHLINLAVTGHTQHGIAAGSYCLMVGDSNSGKAQPVNARVLTPQGWKRIGKLKVGDEVIDPDGSHNAVVTGVYPQGIKAVYEVEFSDGGKTECCADHLWLVDTNNTLSKGRPPMLKKLSDFKDDLFYASHTRKMKYSIPVMQPVAYSGLVKSRLPIHPYLLGVLLGNGHFGQSVLISSTEKEIITRISEQLPKQHYLSHQEKGDYIIACGGRGHAGSNKIKQSVIELGLSGCKANSKFIPSEYLYASVQNRMELLKGLMDTDGYADTKGGISYATVSKDLSTGVLQLVRSLGMIASVSIKESPKYTYRGETRFGQDCYQLQIRPNQGVDVFYLKRKLARNQTRSRNSLRSVVKVSPVGAKECTCISVSSKRGLYVTDDFIVTHNTYVTLATLAEASINPAFDDYRLIYDGPEYGAKMNIEKCFGKKLADRIEIIEPSTTVEEFYDRCDEDFAAGPCIKILDSMDAIMSESDEDQIEKEKVARASGKESKGSYGTAKARANSNRLRSTVNGLQQHGSILFVISQTRDNIGFGSQFNPKVRSGGKALKFYADVEIWGAVRETLKGSYKGKDVQIGTRSLFKVLRSRYTGKQRTVEVPIYHSFGVDDIGACVDFLIEWKHWKSSKGVGLVVPEFDFKGSAESLCKMIDQEKRKPELRKIMGKVWREIEAAVAMERSNPYEEE